MKTDRADWSKANDDGRKSSTGMTISRIVCNEMFPKVNSFSPITDSHQLKFSDLSVATEKIRQFVLFAYEHVFHGEIDDLILEQDRQDEQEITTDQPHLR